MIDCREKYIEEYLSKHFAGNEEQYADVVRMAFNGNVHWQDHLARYFESLGEIDEAKYWRLKEENLEKISESLE